MIPVWERSGRWRRWARVAVAMSGFALLLMVFSATANRLLGWRTPADAAMPIRELGWPLLTWVCYVGAIRVVRVFGGTLYCGSPIWTAYPA